LMNPLKRSGDIRLPCLVPRVGWNGVYYGHCLISSVQKIRLVFRLRFANQAAGCKGLTSSSLLLQCGGVRESIYILRIVPWFTAGSIVNRYKSDWPFAFRRQLYWRSKSHSMTVVELYVLRIFQK
jgi:hypothetical protein